MDKACLVPTYSCWLKKCPIFNNYFVFSPNSFNNYYLCTYQFIHKFKLHYFSFYMEKFIHSKKRQSYRLKHWDYSWNASYFVTICTLRKICCFGSISGGRMNLSPAGAIANVLWYEIKNHAKNVELDNYVVMPNHIHGIITLSNNNHSVGTRHALSSPPSKISKNDKPNRSKFQNQGKNSLSSIVGSYKAAVTKHLTRLGIEFGWQSRFYDHIIRDRTSFLRISEYIDNNPESWHSDKFNPQGLHSND